MDLGDRREVERLVREVIGKSLRQYKDCPKCGEEMAMLRFEVKLWRNSPPKDDYDYDTADRLRCLGCLSVYEDVIQEVKESE